jgi:hypothetical protein
LSRRRAGSSSSELLAEPAADLAAFGMSSATLVQPRVQKLQCPLVCKPCCTCCAPVPVTWCATFCAARCQPLVQPSVQNLLQPGVLPFVQPGMPRLCKPGIATFGTSCVHFARDAQCDSISAIVDLYDRALWSICSCTCKPGNSKI